MEQIDRFVPGFRQEAGSVLARLRWPIPPGVAEAYVEAYTDPGEVVLVPFCQGSEVVREILAAGRQPLALNFDPAVMLLVEALLKPLPKRELGAAVARLGDSQKQGVPLRQYLGELYATTCPACLRPAVVDYFIWDREQGAPVVKHLRCPACTWDGGTSLDSEDLERLAEIPAQGMHYHYVLDRVAPQEADNTLRRRLEYMLEFYSPRNLYALAELTLRIESMFPGQELRRPLKALLLDCLERCSSLAPLPGRSTSRRGLSRPSRYLERNVWHAFEQAIGRLQAAVGKPAGDLAASLEEYHRSPEDWAGFVGQGLIRDLRRHLSTRSVRLILAGPPPLDSAIWSLSYLWGAWLLGAHAVAPLRSLVRQRTPDVAWYARVMAGSLDGLVDFLQDDGRLVWVLSDQRPAVVEALALAAGRAQMGVASLVQCGTDYRMALTPSLPRSVPVGDPDLDLSILRAAASAAADAIRARGEPVPWRTLHAAMLHSLAQQGLLARAWEGAAERPSALDRVDEQIEAALQEPSLVRMVGGETQQAWWWLAQPSELAAPLCDRVEETAYEVLQGALALTRSDFAQRVLAGFPGVLTPEIDLVMACLEAYGCQPSPGYWQLRSEDLSDARAAERKLMVEHLAVLGQRLGYRAEAAAPFDVAWLEGDLVRAAFVVRWKAALGQALTLSDELAGANPYLVIPGGRAALLSHKLAHNLLWQETVDESGWRFIKYRHVRQLYDQPEVDEYTLRTIIGLDPIVEREVAQIPLF